MIGVTHLEEKLKEHCSSLEGMEYKSGQSLFSEDLNLIVNIHRETSLPEDRLVCQDNITLSAFPLAERPVKRVPQRNSRYKLLKEKT
jgi:hypothetical protein